jgi:acyl carrier protein
MEILYIILGFALFISLGAVYQHYRLKSIALNRGEADICAYARSFDYGNVDTKIMRAVFENVQEWVGKYEGKPFPVQANDDFDEIYQMDSDDLDEIYWEVADELGISTDRAEENPYYGKVKSVKELVLFLHNQPRASNA